MTIRRVMVIGSGLMGTGIAQVCAQAGLTVFLNDISPDALDYAMKNISWSLDKLIEKSLLTERKEIILKRISPLTNLHFIQPVDLTIEAVFEKIELKKKIFQSLDNLTGPETYLASNTSAIPITELAAMTKRPEKVLGLHFFSPVPLMQAVEVIRGMATGDETIHMGKTFVQQIGKEPIMVHRDIAGFLINRINFPSAIEAMRLVEEGVATCEDIDKGLRLGAGRRMGIFETGDMVGLDVTCSAMMAVYEETGDPRFYPPLLLRRKVKAGHLGRKAGKGWYEYNEDGTRKCAP